jgi:hypothetical protein
MQPERPRYHLAIPSAVIALSAALGSTGCTVNTAELLTLRFVGGADVDVNCANGGCESSSRVAAQIMLEESSQLPNDAIITFSQYRVDYQLEAGPPSLSSATSVLVGWGETVPFSPRVAGDEQRQWGQSQGGERAGLATLTISGIDHDNAPVELSGSFEIVFGDFVTPSGAGGSGSGGNTSGAGGSGGAGGN